MARSLFETSRRRISSIPAVSLTDIVFLLLIFFLLSSSFVVQPGIKIDLPRTQTAEPEPHNRVVVTVTERGEIFLGARRIGAERLEEELRHALDPVQEVPSLIIRADRVSQFHWVVSVLDAGRRAGYQRLLIASKPEDAR
ncbi:biopolymer transporter ExbD [Candidatus Fermentibacteria bacterium]|nr:biopolymer transporter ExbD [Candidatus Fermentibacteria bacterium]